MIWKLIRRNVAGKPFRFLLTCSAVTAGVMFVVGIFVFTDGLRETFSELAGDIEGNVDLALFQEQTTVRRSRNDLQLHSLHARLRAWE